MQPLSNILKVLQANPTGSLKKQEPFIKHTKNKLSLITEYDEPNTSLVKTLALVTLVKPRRWNNLIVKFENLKQKLLSSGVNHKEINVKNNLN